MAKELDKIITDIIDKNPSLTPQAVKQRIDHEARDKLESYGLNYQTHFVLYNYTRKKIAQTLYQQPWSK